MTRNQKQNLIVIILLVVFTSLASLSVYTIFKGIDLMTLSDDQRNADTWRTGDAGKAAANKAQESIANDRQQIYNSNAYIHWLVCKLDKTTRAFVGTGIVSSPIIFLFLVKIIILIFNFNRKIRTMKKRRRLRVRVQ